MFRSNKILTLSGFLLLVMLAGCSDGSDNRRDSVVEEAVQAQDCYVAPSRRGYRGEHHRS